MKQATYIIANILWLLLLSLLGSQNARSQALPGVGVGIPGIGVGGVGIPINIISEYPNPYANKAPAYRSVYLFKASEFASLGGQPQAIRSVFFYDSIPQGALLQNFTIRMMQVNWDTMPLSVPDAGLLTVYGPKTYVDRKGFNEHALDVPFCWDGQSNFIVDICVQNQPNDKSFNATIKATLPDSGVFYSMHDWNNTGAPICAQNQQVQPQRFEKRPQTSFSGIHRDSVDLRMYSVYSPAELVDINTQQIVSIRFQNYSCANVVGAKLGYQWNNLPPVIESYPGTVAPGAYLNYTFNTPILTDQTQYSSLKIWTQHPGDHFNQNDTVSFLVFVKNGQFEGLDYTGKEFWVAFMQNFDNLNVDQKLFITSTKNTPVQVEMPLLGWSTTVNVVANQVTSVTVPKVAGGVVTATEPSEVISKTGIHITSAEEVSVYGYSGQAMSSDAYLAIPRRNLGRKYTVTAPTGIYNPKTVGNILLNAPAEFILVGTEDNSTVEIIPEAPTEKAEAKDTIRLTLNRGETYLVKARIDSNSVGVASYTYDLSGSRIISDKKLGLLGGSQCAFIPGITAPDKCQSCDHLIEMITPPITWGKSFVATDFEFKTGEDVLRLVNAEDTVVPYTLNGIPDSLPPLGYKDKKFTGTVVVEASKPIQAIQMCTGGQCTVPATSTDPFITNLIPEAQWGNLYTFSTTLTPNLSLHYINIMKRSAQGRVALDGYRIPDGYFAPINGTPYYAAKVPVSQGAHKVTGDSAICVTVYGFGKDNSYGYPASGSYLKVINQPPIYITSETQDVRCYGAKNGYAKVEGHDGTPPYGFYWSDGFIGPERNDLDTGTYWVFVEDDYGYQDTAYITIKQPDSLSLSLQESHLTCFQSGNGSIVTQTSSGVPPYTFTWADGPTTPSRSNLAAGNYSLTIEDQNGCKKTKSLTITEPAKIILTPQVLSPACNNGSDGQINLKVQNGVRPFQFQLNGGSLQLDSSFKNLSSGTYNLNVRDANGCQASAVATLINPAPIVLNLSATGIGCFATATGTAKVTGSGGYGSLQYQWNSSPIQTGSQANNLNRGFIVLTATDGRCTKKDSIRIDSVPSPQITIYPNAAVCNKNNGSAVAVITGGQGAYTYYWETVPPSFVSTINNLAPGNYKVFLGDATCKKRVNFTIDHIPGPDFLVSTKQSSCGLNNGEAEIQINQSTGPYQIKWNFNPPLLDSLKVKQLSPGNYSVEVKDNICPVTKTFSINSKPELKFGPFIKNAPDCNTNNGSIRAQISGGSGPVTVTWLTSPPFVGLQLDNIYSGIYRVQATDGECLIETSVSISSKNGPQISLNGTNAICGENNGSLQAQISGGTGSYTIMWNNNPSLNTANLSNIPAGQYSIEVNDGTCIASADTILPGRPFTPVLLSAVSTTCGLNNGSALATAQSDGSNYQYYWDGVLGTKNLTNAAPGWHQFKLFDGLCWTIDSIEIYRTEPLKLALVNIDSSSCSLPTGSAEISISGGNGLYSGYWNTDPIQLSPLASNLPAGTYTYYCTDFYCTDSLSVTVPNFQKPGYQVNTSPEHCNTSDGQVTITPGPYSGQAQILWSDGNTALSRSGLSSGFWTFTLEDDHCFTTDSIFISGSPSPIIKLDSLTPAHCALNNGAAYLSATQPNGPVSYTWLPSVSTGSSASLLDSGLYSVIVRDTWCADTMLIQLPRVPEIELALNGVYPAECALNNGEAVAAISSGAPPYQISWLNSGETSLRATMLPDGWNTVQVSDSYCTKLDSILINRISKAIIDSSIIWPDWCGRSVGGAKVFVSQGSGNYQYRWTPFTSNQSNTLNNVPSGSYTLQITDGRCIQNVPIVIPRGYAPKGKLSELSPEHCDLADGRMQVLNLQPDSATVYWPALGQYGLQQNALKSGLYSVILSNGQCDTLIYGSLSELPGPLVQSSHFPDTCNSSRGLVSLNVTGLNPPFTYQLDTLIQSTPSFTQLSSGTYLISVRDALGCTHQENVDIENIELRLPSQAIRYEPFDPIPGDPMVFSANGLQSWIPMQWTDNIGGISSAATHQLIAPPANKILVVNLLARHQLGCLDSSSIMVQSKNDHTIYIPTSFTPNGDNFNERFAPVTTGIKKLSGEIYNRWGEKIFEFKSLDDSWDGTYLGSEVKSDTYVFVFTFTTIAGKKITHDGKVTLLR